MASMAAFLAAAEVHNPRSRVWESSNPTSDSWNARDWKFGAKCLKKIAPQNSLKNISLLSCMCTYTFFMAHRIFYIHITCLIPFIFFGKHVIILRNSQLMLYTEVYSNLLLFMFSFTEHSFLFINKITYIISKL